jgi:hypothetical protein
MAYDYERYEVLIKEHLENMWRDVDALDVGDNISDVPEVKIIFDGYGYDEETNEDNGDKNMESYAIFIHKDALTPDFEFPEHEMTPWALIHRPKDEVCIYAWYDVEKNYWEILPLEDRLDGCDMTEEQVMEILEGLHERYFVVEEDDTPVTPSSAWPFPGS